MQVLNINKSDRTGGAAVAAMRLVKALRKEDVEVRFLVEEKRTDNAFVVESRWGRLGKGLGFLNFVAERLYFYPHERDPSVRFSFSPAWAGQQRLHRNNEVAKAGLLHFHWFNQGFISLAGLRKLFGLGKPIVWTLHDMWAFTGGCHYSSHCENFMRTCGWCHMQKKASGEDLSAKVLEAKQFIAQTDKLTIVTCSEWLADKARNSSLLRGKRVISIPNPIDIDRFSPADVTSVRKELQLPQEKSVVLFGAANIDDQRKGFRYLKQALDKIKEKQGSSDVHLLLFGKAKEETLNSLPFPYTHFSFADGELIVKLYNAANVMVLPSLQDNLPNTIMESMACGTPVVAFRTGGIPEMVENGRNGYLADVQNVDQLAEGMEKCCVNYDIFSKAARDYVLENYSEEIVAKRYIAEYKKLMTEEDVL